METRSTPKVRKALCLSLIHIYPYVKFLAGAVHVADRVDVLLLERPQADVVEVERLLAASRPGAFSPLSLIHIYVTKVGHVE